MPYREAMFCRGEYFHVYSRGNEKKTIFLDAVDYSRFISRMREYSLMHGIGIISYCLMPNHFHLLISQKTDKTVSSFMHRLTVSYAMYFNKRHERVGHLFQGRFKVKPVEKDSYLLHLSRYIHLNPLEITGNAPELRHYSWSSYSEYLQPSEKVICEPEIVLQQFNNTEAYARFVNCMISANELSSIKHLIMDA